jgi:hypothetical protein
MIRDACGVPIRMMFKTIIELCSGNCSLVVELMPTVDLVESRDRRSRRIAEVKHARMLVFPPISTISLHCRYYLC